MRAMPSAKTVNIDAMLHEELGDVDVSKIPTVDVEVFDETFKIRKDINAFNVLSLGDIEASGDTTVIAKTMVGIIHPDDRPAFKRAIGMQAGLTVERLMFVFEKLVEAASDGNPTRSSAGSSGGTGRKAAGSRSVAKSSVAVARRTR
jgi:hypothetical protein